MKSNKGFTLIELLAVIIILAVIALIATPLIMSTINDAKKGAAVNSAYGYISAVENAIAIAMINDTTTTYAGGTLSLANNSSLNYVYTTTNEGTSSSASTVLSVSYKGTAPTSVNLTVSSGVVTGGTLTIDGFSLTVSENGSVTAG